MILTNNTLYTPAFKIL